MDQDSPAKKFITSLGFGNPKKKAKVAKHFGLKGWPPAPGPDDRGVEHPHAEHEDVHGRRGGSISGSKQTLMILLRRASQLYNADIPEWDTLEDMSPQRVWDEAAAVFGGVENTKQLINELPERSGGENVDVNEVPKDLISRYYTGKRKNPKDEDGESEGGARTHDRYKEKEKDAEEYGRKTQGKEPVNAPIEEGSGLPPDSVYEDKPTSYEDFTPETPEVDVDESRSEQTRANPKTAEEAKEADTNFRRKNKSFIKNAKNTIKRAWNKTITGKELPTKKDTFLHTRNMKDARNAYQDYLDRDNELTNRRTPHQRALGELEDIKNKVFSRDLLGNKVVRTPYGTVIEIPRDYNNNSSYIDRLLFAAQDPTKTIEQKEEEIRELIEQFGGSFKETIEAGLIDSGVSPENARAWFESVKDDAPVDPDNLPADPTRAILERLYFGDIYDIIRTTKHGGRLKSQSEVIEENYELLMALPAADSIDDVVKFFDGLDDISFDQTSLRDALAESLGLKNIVLDALELEIGSGVEGVSRNDVEEYKKDLLRRAKKALAEKGFSEELANEFLDIQLKIKEFDEANQGDEYPDWLSDLFEDDTSAEPEVDESQTDSSIVEDILNQELFEAPARFRVGYEDPNDACSLVNMNKAIGPSCAKSVSEKLTSASLTDPVVLKSISDAQKITSDRYILKLIESSGGRDNAGNAERHVFSVNVGYPSNFVVGEEGLGRKKREIIYDPNFIEIVDVTDVEGGTEAVLKDTLPNNYHGKIEEVVSSADRLMFRGMSFEEYQNIRKTGVIQSAGDHNIGGKEIGLTFFSPNVNTAAHYANGFAPIAHMPTPVKPAYVIVTRVPDSALTPENSDRVPSGEIAIDGQLDASYIEQVIELNVVSTRSAEWELRRSDYQHGDSHEYFLYADPIGGMVVYKDVTSDFKESIVDEDQTEPEETPPTDDGFDGLVLDNYEYHMPWEYENFADKDTRNEVEEFFTNQSTFKFSKALLKLVSLSYDLREPEQTSASEYQRPRTSLNLNPEDTKKLNSIFISAIKELLNSVYNSDLTVDEKSAIEVAFKLISTHKFNNRRFIYSRDRPDTTVRSILEGDGFKPYTNEPMPYGVVADAFLEAFLYIQTLNNKIPEYKEDVERHASSLEAQYYDVINSHIEVYNATLEKYKKLQEANLTSTLAKKVLDVYKKLIKDMEKHSPDTFPDEIPEIVSKISELVREHGLKEILAGSGNSITRPGSGASTEIVLERARDVFRFFSEMIPEDLKDRMNAAYYDSDKLIELLQKFEEEAANTVGRGNRPKLRVIEGLKGKLPEYIKLSENSKKIAQEVYEVSVNNPINIITEKINYLIDKLKMYSDSELEAASNETEELAASFVGEGTPSDPFAGLFNDRHMEVLLLAGDIESVLSARKQLRSVTEDDVNLHLRGLLGEPAYERTYSSSEESLADSLNLSEKNKRELLKRRRVARALKELKALDKFKDIFTAFNSKAVQDLISNNANAFFLLKALGKPPKRTVKSIETKLNDILEMYSNEIKNLKNLIKGNGNKLDTFTDILTSDLETIVNVIEHSYQEAKEVLRSKSKQLLEAQLTGQDEERIKKEIDLLVEALAVGTTRLQFYKMELARKRINEKLNENTLEEYDKDVMSEISRITEVMTTLAAFTDAVNQKEEIGNVLDDAIQKICDNLTEDIIDRIAVTNGEFDKLTELMTASPEKRLEIITQGAYLGSGLSPADHKAEFYQRYGDEGVGLLNEDEEAYDNYDTAYYKIKSSVNNFSEFLGSPTSPESIFTAYRLGIRQLLSKLEGIGGEYLRDSSAKKFLRVSNIKETYLQLVGGVNFEFERLTQSARRWGTQDKLIKVLNKLSFYNELPSLKQLKQDGFDVEVFSKLNGWVPSGDLRGPVDPRKFLIDGWILIDLDTPDGSTLATMSSEGYMTLHPKWFKVAVETKKNVFFHEIGHNLESSMTLSEKYYPLLSKISIGLQYMPLSGKVWSLGYSNTYSEHLADGYAILSSGDESSLRFNLSRFPETMKAIYEAAIEFGYPVSQNALRMVPEFFNKNPNAKNAEWIDPRITLIPKARSEEDQKSVNEIFQKAIDAMNRLTLLARARHDSPTGLDGSTDELGSIIRSLIGSVNTHKDFSNLSMEVYDMADTLVSLTDLPLREIDKRIGILNAAGRFHGSLTLPTSDRYMLPDDLAGESEEFARNELNKPLLTLPEEGLKSNKDVQFELGSLDSSNVCSLVPRTPVNKLEKRVNSECAAQVSNVLQDIGIPEEAHVIDNYLTAKALISDRLSFSRNSELDANTAQGKEYGLTITYDIPESWGTHEDLRYDPNYIEIVDEVLRVKTSLQNNYFKSIEEIVGDYTSWDLNIIARGLAYEELNNVLNNGEIASTGAGNTAGQTGLTFFSTNYSVADGYAGEYSSTAYTPTVNKPGYVLFINRPESALDSSISDVVDGSSVALPGTTKITRDTVSRIIEVRPIVNSQSINVKLSKDIFSDDPDAYSFSFQGSFNQPMFAYKDVTDEILPSLAVQSSHDQSVLDFIDDNFYDINDQAFNNGFDKEKVKNISYNVNTLLTSSEVNVNDTLLDAENTNQNDVIIHSQSPLMILVGKLADTLGLINLYPGSSENRIITAKSLAEEIQSLVSDYQDLTDADYSLIPDVNERKEVEFNNNEIVDKLSPLLDEVINLVVFDRSLPVRELEKAARSVESLSADKEKLSRRKEQRKIAEQYFGQGAQENNETVSGGAMSGVMPVLTARDDNGDTQSKYIFKNIFSQSGTSEAIGLNMAGLFNVQDMVPAYGIVDEENVVNLSDTELADLSEDEAIANTNAGTFIELVEGRPMLSHSLTSDYNTIAMSRYRYYLNMGYSSVEAAKRSILDSQRLVLMDGILATSDRTNGGNILYNGNDSDIKLVDFGYILSGYDDLMSGYYDEDNLDEAMSELFMGTLAGGFDFKNLLPEIIEELKQISGRDVMRIIEDMIGSFPSLGLLYKDIVQLDMYQQGFALAHDLDELEMAINTVIEYILDKASATD